jgi:hypothetical protein
MLSLDDFEPADTAADVNAKALGFIVVVWHFQTSRFNGKLGRRDGKLNESAHLFDVSFFDVIQRVEILHLTRDAACEL